MAVIEEYAGTNIFWYYSVTYYHRSASHSDRINLQLLFNWLSNIWVRKHFCQCGWVDLKVATVGYYPMEADTKGKLLKIRGV